MGTNLAGAYGVRQLALEQLERHMMQTVTVTKWIVNVDLKDREPIKFWIHDNFAGNVLRKLADLQFTDGVRDEPARIIIERVIE